MTDHQFKSKNQDELKAILTTLNKNHKNVIRQGTDGPIIKHPSISTGSFGLDIAMGIGGFPVGRHIEIYGPESSGKSSLSLHTIARCQAAGGTCAYIDAEHSLDLKYARALGVDIDKLIISQPDYGEQALEIVEELIRAGLVDLVVVDSVAALVPKSELEGDIGDFSVGSQARMMSQALRMLTGITTKQNATIIWINQIRHKIGGYGNPETVSGGNSLKYYASTRLDIRKTEKIIDASTKEIVGNKTKVTVVKNKVAPPNRVVEFEIKFGRGIDRTGEIIDIAIEKELIQRKGAWLYYKGENFANGRVKAIERLEEEPSLKQQIEDEIMAMVNEPEILTGIALPEII